MSKKNVAFLKEENLLTLLSQNNFIVPEIQREYVWGENNKVIIGFLKGLKSKIGDSCNLCNLPSSENKINIGFLYSYKPEYVKIEQERFLDENLIQKILCPGIFRIFEKTNISPPFNDLSLIHEDDLISHFPGESHLMGDYNHGHPTL